MSKQIEAMKMALEAMQKIQNADMDSDFLNIVQADELDVAISALRKALMSVPDGAEQPAQPTTDTVMQAFTGLPKRKLDMLMSADWRINGVSIEHEEAGVIKRGAVTFGGMVLWWNAPQAQQKPVEKDAYEWGDRLNNASWAAVKAWDENIMGPMSGAVFNNIKGVVRAAILTYLDGKAAHGITKGNT